MELLPSQLIQLKRDNQKIDPKQIEKFISAVSRREIPDYQVSALLMAIFFRGLTETVINGYAGTLYALFEERYQVHMVRAEEKLRAVAASADSAALLGVPAGEPLLSVERVAYTYGGRPVELRRALYVTTGHHYHNELI